MKAIYVLKTKIREKNLAGYAIKCQYFWSTIYLLLFRVISLIIVQFMESHSGFIIYRVVYFFFLFNSVFQPYFLFSLILFFCHLNSILSPTHITIFFIEHKSELFMSDVLIFKDYLLLIILHLHDLFSINYALVLSFFIYFQ